MAEINFLQQINQAQFILIQDLQKKLKESEEKTRHLEELLKSVEHLQIAVKS